MTSQASWRHCLEELNFVRWMDRQLPWNLPVHYVISSVVDATRHGKLKQRRVAMQQECCRSEEVVFCYGLCVKQYVLLRIAVTCNAHAETAERRSTLNLTWQETSGSLKGTIEEKRNDSQLEIIRVTGGLGMGLDKKHMSGNLQIHMHCDKKMCCVEKSTHEKIALNCCWLSSHSPQ